MVSHSWVPSALVFTSAGLVVRRRHRHSSRTTAAIVDDMSTSALMGGVGDVAASCHAVLSSSQAVSLGLNPTMSGQLVRDGVLRIEAPNVLAIHGAPRTWQQRLRAATLTGGGHGVASHRSAALLHRIDGFVDGVIEITTKRGAKIRLDEVVQHQYKDGIERADLVEIDGIACTSLARTLIDLPAVVDNRTIERALDDFERRGQNLLWLEQRATALHRPGQRGTKLILVELARRRRRGEVRGSWFEKLIEECLRSPVLPPVVTQFVIRGDDGEFIARVDLAIPSLRIAIEAHSRRFHLGEHEELIDQRRDNRGALAGWDFRYFGWADRRSPAAARQFIEQLAFRRGADLGVALNTAK